MPAETGPVAVWGGGRWGGVLVGKLAEILPPAATPLFWISARDAAGCRRRVAAEGLAARVQVADDRGTPAAPFAVAIATAPTCHEADAAAALEAGAHVMVEKPLCLDPQAAAALAARAQGLGRVLACDLVFRTAPFLESFAEMAGARLGPPARLALAWGDPAVEHRDGVEKRADRRTPIAFDLVPHAISVLQAILPEAVLTLTASRITDDAGARLTGQLNGPSGPLAVTLDLTRNATARRRRLRYEDPAGAALILDFAREPGHVESVPNCRETGGPAVALPAGRSPLTVVFERFMRAATHGADPDEPLVAPRCLESVRAAAEADTLIADATWTALAAPETSEALRERLLADWAIGALGREDPSAARRAEAQEAAWLPRLARALGGAPSLPDAAALRGLLAPDPDDAP